MKITYNVSKGINKEKCDDCALIGSTVINNESGFVEVEYTNHICIGDGVGGNAGGNEASIFVMQNIANLNLDYSNDQLRANLLNINDMLVIYAKSVSGHANMATTFTGLFFDKNGVKIAHCGNTRVYALQGNFLKQITLDQTLYQWLVSIGNIDAAEGCNRNEIRGAFGGGSSKYVDLLSVDNVFEKGLPPLILLTSDGIHDSLDIDEIEDIVAEAGLSSKEKVNKMIDTAVGKGTQDDCTVILVQI